LTLTGDRVFAERMLDGLVAVTVAAGAAARTFVA
jgi:hypothetical protein